MIARLAAGCLAAGAVALLCPVRATPVLSVLPVPSTASGAIAVPTDWLHRHRLLWSLLAACAAWLLFGGVVGAVGAVAAAAGCWVLVGRAEPTETRVRREGVRHDLPVLVELLAAALTSGAAPGEALVMVVDALPGPGADELAPLIARLRLGADPADAWRALGAVPELAPLGRTLSRAHSTGAPVSVAVERLAEELARAARSAAEERARQVGVKAAVPLGVCLLPAFLLIGIVPVVGALLTGLGL